MIKSFGLFISALAMASAASSAQAQANLVTNGGFEQTTVSGNFEFDASYAPGANGLTGWASGPSYNLLFHSDNANTAAGNAAGNYSSTGKEYLWGSTPSPLGGNFVALDGDLAFTQAMTQTINGLAAGQSYTLSFYWAAAQLASRTGATTEQIQYSLGNDVFKTSIISNPSQGFSGWNLVTRNFFATSSSEVLSFLSLGTPTGLPPVALLDGVSLAAVPESATWAMMIVGFGITGVVLRDKRRRRTPAAV